MNIAELALKIGITIVVVVFMYYQLAFLKWTWFNQIDPKQTFSRFLKKATPSAEVIATRDPNKIYQNGNPVGNITGNVTIKDNNIIFEKLIETSALERNIPFEYKRDTYKIIKIEQEIGAEISNITGFNKNVLKNVVCEKMK
jgi:hypothetical protein